MQATSVQRGSAPRLLAPWRRAGSIDRSARSRPRPSFATRRRRRPRPSPRRARAAVCSTASAWFTCSRQTQVDLVAGRGVAAFGIAAERRAGEHSGDAFDQRLFGNGHAVPPFSASTRSRAVWVQEALERSSRRDDQPQRQQRPGNQRSIAARDRIGDGRARGVRRLRRPPPVETATFENGSGLALISVRAPGLAGMGHERRAAAEQEACRPARLGRAPSMIAIGEQALRQPDG